MLKHQKLISEAVQAIPYMAKSKPYLYLQKFHLHGVMDLSTSGQIFNQCCHGVLKPSLMTANISIKLLNHLVLTALDLDNRTYQGIVGEKLGQRPAHEY